MCLIDNDGSAFQGGTIEIVHGGSRLLHIAHFDKAKPFTAPHIPIHDHRG